MTNTHSNLVNQNGEVADVALATLAARTALLLDADFAAITATFLAFRVRYFLKTSAATAGEGPLVVCLADGNASIPEITDALTKRNTAGPADVTQMLTQDQPWIVSQNSVEMLIDSDSGSDSQTSGRWMSLGKKGVPYKEGSGWTLNVFNADNAALTTGQILKGTYQIQGVWLRD